MHESTCLFSYCMLQQVPCVCGIFNQAKHRGSGTSNCTSDTQIRHCRYLMAVQGLNWLREKVFLCFCGHHACKDINLYSSILASPHNNSVDNLHYVIAISKKYIKTNYVCKAMRVFINLFVNNMIL